MEVNQYQLIISISLGLIYLKLTRISILSHIRGELILAMEQRLCLFQNTSFIYSTCCKRLLIVCLILIIAEKSCEDQNIPG